MLTEEPRVVKSHDIRIDTDYVNWIAEVKHRYRSAQVKAAVKVNAEKLLFNWQFGRDLVQKKAEERWGAGVVEQVSLDLKREFPDAEGFSTRNLWYMKQWYIFYTSIDSQLLQRVGAEIKERENHQFDGDFPLPFALIPWRHHVEIITKCKSIEEALFYIQQVMDKGLSRPALINCIKSNLYEHQGKIINNFTDHLPALQSKLIQIKDALPSQEQLAERVRLLQKELKEAKRLINKV